MPTQYKAEAMEFARPEGRAVVADLGGGAITLEAGTLPLYSFSVCPTIGSP